MLGLLRGGRPCSGTVDRAALLDFGVLQLSQRDDIPPKYIRLGH